MTCFRFCLWFHFLLFGRSCIYIYTYLSTVCFCLQVTGVHRNQGSRCQRSAKTEQSRSPESWTECMKTVPLHFITFAAFLLLVWGQVVRIAATQCLDAVTANKQPSAPVRRRIDLLWEFPCKMVSSAAIN